MKQNEKYTQKCIDKIKKNDYNVDIRNNKRNRNGGETIETITAQ